MNLCLHFTRLSSRSNRRSEPRARRESTKPGTEQSGVYGGREGSSLSLQQAFIGLKKYVFKNTQVKVNKCFSLKPNKELTNSSVADSSITHKWV